MTKRTAPCSLFALILILLAGCVTTEEGADLAAARSVDKTAAITPVVMPGARRAALAKLPSGERNQYCRFGVTGAILDVEARISGPIRRQHSNAQSAGNAILETVEGWYAGHPLAFGYLRNALEEGARIGAFTKIMPYSPPEFSGYNPMNEPIFQVGNFLLALSHGYLILKEELPVETELLAAVRRWGDRLFELTSNASDTFGGRSKGVDRRFLIAQGWAHWGNATGNRKALDAAYRYYLRGMSVVGRNGEDRLWHRVFPKRRIYYANMTYSAAQAAAYALSRSGAGDVYDVAPGGGSLVEGAAWLWDVLVEEQPGELMKGRGKGSRTVAWTELFVHEFPDHPASGEMNAWLADQWQPRYGYTGSGGPTTCLYRRIGV